MNGPPSRAPLGLQLTRASRVLGRAFDEALVGAGGSLPVWLILVSLKAAPLRSQRELAESVGVQEATISHHLNTMVAQGLLTRERDPANRRVHQVRLTDAGEAAFLRLRDVAVAFDERIRRGLSESQTRTLERLLERLVANATDGGPVLV